MLIAKQLSAEAFAPYGDVIDTQEAKHFDINYGLTTRFHDMANIDVREKGGEAGFSIFKAQTAVLPHQVKVMEYHPFGSQLFYPIGKIPFIVLVAPPSESLPIDQLELFVTNGKQGVNFNKGTWHHFLLPLSETEKTSQFIVIDRIADDKNCVEVELDKEVIIQL